MQRRSFNACPRRVWGVFCRMGVSRPNLKGAEPLKAHIEVACYDRAKPRDEWVSTELKDLASLMLPASSKPA